MMNIKCTFLPVLLLVLVSSFSCADEIRFAYQDRVADAASIVALEEGIFSAAGLQIKRMRFSSGPATSEALYTGAADIGTMGMLQWSSPAPGMPDWLFWPVMVAVNTAIV